MDRQESVRRARVILARMISDASALALKLAEEPSRMDVDARDAAGLGEYAGMLEDAIEGREPYARGARTQKVRKAFGYGGRS